MDLFALFLEPFQWQFMRMALLAVLVISPLFGLLSTMVVTSRMSFFSDALGHSAFTGIAIGALCGLAEPMWMAVALAAAFALLFTWVRRRSNMASDTVIGVFSSTAVALGIFIATLDGGSFTRYNSLLIGDILSVEPAKIALLALILPELAARVNAPDALHLHTSGSMGLDVFAGHARHFGVLYPLQTFSKHKAIRFPEINFFIEGNDDFAQRKVREMASALSRHVQELDSAGRKRMHLAAVFACNFTNHLYEIAAELLAEVGIDFRVMLPLIDETTEKIKTLSPYEAQTGPAVRNDRNITDKHLALLAGKRELETIYRLLTDDIHTIHHKGQNP